MHNQRYTMSQITRRNMIGLVICAFLLTQLAQPTLSITNNDTTKDKNKQATETPKEAQIRGTSEQVFSSNDEPEVTFQYEPDEFINKNNKQANPTSSSTTSTTSKPSVQSSPKQQQDANDGSPKDTVTQASEQERNYLLPPPSTKPTRASSSGRGGRMLDLDVLMGEKSPIRERSMNTGNRQSRSYVSSSGGTGSLDLGNKKLKIQGFIPIVSMKDDDSSSDDNSNESNHNNQHHNQPHQRFLQQSSGSQSELGSSSLPYAQSSIGHASFGVQRYLNEPPQFVNNDQQAMYQSHQQAASGSSVKSSVVDTLKRPLKRLASLTSSHNQESSGGKLMQLPSGQDCLCVPFYMCKNGFVSESSVSKAQIQQMIAQQLQSGPRSQQFTLASSPEDSPASVSAMQALLSAPSNQLTSSNNNQQAQYADSVVPVDERSMDQSLISTMNFSNSLGGSLDDSASSNKTDDASFPVIQELTSENNNNNSNGTQQKQASSEDYSQEILGRMLGLRAPTRMSGAGPAGLLGGSTSGNSGSCGVLRTCCAIPPHMLANNGLSSPPVQSTIESSASGLSLMRQQQQQQLQSSAQLHNQQVAQQRFQQQQQQQQQIPKPAQANNYGFPTASGSNMMMQQPYASNGMSTLSTSMTMISPLDQTSSLAHRSTQFQQLNNQLQQQQTRPQYQMQALQSQLSPSAIVAGSQILASQPPSWQQQQQASRPTQLINNNNNLMRQQYPSQLQSQPLQQSQPFRSTLVQGGQTSRKILDGRCGLRQSSGINGRVQNLQYQENSADFGEYPAQAAILKKLGGSDSLFVCGGTLISQYWLATAAHCIKKHMTNELKVRLGEWDVHRDDEFYPFVEKDIRDVVIHPEFVSGNLVNDIALLRLDSPVDPTLPHVNPACLPSLDENFSRQRCWVTGWGKDSFGTKGTFQSVLQEVELPVAEHGECEMALRQTRLGPHYRLHPGFICAGGEGGRDACEGDGGSGLYCVQPDGIIKVAGLVSWGIGCGQAGVPGVYVNMAHYRSWIENIIAIDEDIYSPYMNTLAGNVISERSNENANNRTITMNLGLNIDSANSNSSTSTIPVTTTTTIAPPQTTA